MFLNGKQWSLAEMLGAHVQSGGQTRFRVWAPRAAAVALVLGDDHDPQPATPMAQVGEGVWETTVEAPAGTSYRFAITGADGVTTLKADPMAQEAAARPSDCSVVTTTRHSWGDQAWMAARATTNLRRSPLAIYEVHLGSWRRNPDDPGRQLPYTELAGPLADHVGALGFTHVELLPVAAHPYPGSWGYHGTSYYAPDPRHGRPDDLRFLIDTLHQRGIGVILDWVPGHFADDAWALADFDGGPTYEHPDPRRGTQPTWGSRVFDYGRPEVRAFLLSSVSYWLKEFHADGLRIDAVASMLRHDWGRGEDQVLANPDGSLEHHEAISFLRELTSAVPAIAPGAVTIAEEATGWPKVTHPVDDGGLGFTFAWNMGWTNDWLSYAAEPPAGRPARHNVITFASSYADAEQFVLALSHDNVHEASLLEQMWGDRGQQVAGQLALFGLMLAHRGKKSVFMGTEFGQRQPWSHHQSLDWHLLEEAGGEATRVQSRLAALLHAYRSRPALWARDDDGAGMHWVAADDRDSGVYVFARRGPGDELVVCAANLSAEPRAGYRITDPLIAPHAWRAVLPDDPVPMAAGPATVTLDLPPLSCCWIEPDDRDLLAVFCDPQGSAALAALHSGAESLPVLSPEAFLARGARSLPIRSSNEAQHFALTAMAEAWAGAVRTWHDTQRALRPPGLSEPEEFRTYARLAAAWPVAPDAAAAEESEYYRALCGDEAFRYSFDGVAARAIEIGARILRGQAVLNETMRPGLPLTPIPTAPPGEPHDRVVAFMRGSDLIVAVAVGDRATGACGWGLPKAATGTWRDRLTGATFSLPDGATLAGVLGPDGRALLDRV